MDRIATLQQLYTAPNYFDVNYAPGSYANASNNISNGISIDSVNQSNNIGDMNIGDISTSSTSQSVSAQYKGGVSN